MNIITDGKSYISVISSPTDMEKLSPLEMHLNLLVDKIAMNIAEIYDIQLTVPPQFLYANNYAVFVYMTAQRDLLEEKNMDFYQRVEEKLFDGYVDYSEFVAHNGVIDEMLKRELDEKEYQIHGFTFKKYHIHSIGFIYAKVKQEIKAPAYSVKEQMEQNRINFAEENEQIPAEQKELHVQQVNGQTDYIYYEIKLSNVLDLAQIPRLKTEKADLMTKREQGKNTYAIKFRNNQSVSYIMSDFGTITEPIGWKLMKQDILNVL